MLKGWNCLRADGEQHEERRQAEGKGVGKQKNKDTDKSTQINDCEYESMHR